MTLEVTQVPQAAGPADSGNKVWVGFRVKAGEGERYENVLMNIIQASILTSNLTDAINKANKDRGGLPAQE